MDALVEGPLNLVSDGPVDRKNKWRSYREGRHTPSAGLIEGIESRFPGSRAVLNHPVWQVLRLDRPLQDEVPGLLAQLPLTLFATIKGSGAAARCAPMSPLGWDTRRLRRLEREVGFNTLACLVALMRLAAESGDSAGAHRFGRSICRVLLMMGGWLFSHGVAQPFADYVERFLLPMAAHAGQQNGFGEMGFLAAARRLAGAANAVAAAENTALRGHYCADLMLGLLYDKFSMELSGLVTSTPSAAVMPGPVGACS